jgi:hypothetical protein
MSRSAKSSDIRSILSRYIVYTHFCPTFLEGDLPPFYNRGSLASPVSQIGDTSLNPESIQ